MKVAVVTGGNKGLGIAQTARFVDEGYKTYVVARSRGELEILSGETVFVETDLAHDHSASFLDRIYAETGRIDVLVNNAGIHLKKPMWDVSTDEFDKVIGLNVRVMFAACGRYVDLQGDAGGAIVNISSMAGLMGLPATAAYTTAKTAVIGLTRSLAVDAARKGFRANAVAPGFIDTDMTRAAFNADAARKEKVLGRVPGGKFGLPEDVANAVFFLASAEAGYINGVVLPVDDGYSIGF